MPGTNGTKALRMIGLTRKSKGDDEGTHVDQQRRIERVCEREGFTLVRVMREHKVSGAKDWRNREPGAAIEAVKNGEADGIVMSDVDRVTRQRLLAAVEIWQAMADAGAVFVTDDGVDSRDENAEFFFGMRALMAREQWKSIKRKSDAGRIRANQEHGVHGGALAPLGYTHAERDSYGKVKHGRLVPDENASRVRAAFEARAEGRPWREVVGILGVASQGAASNLLRNRVYLGEARMGDDAVNVGAHPEIVDETLFRRANQRRERSVSYGGREGALLGGKILRCATCGYSLTQDASKAGDHYRCKNLKCPARASVQAAIVEPVVLEIALGWHRVASPDYLLTRQVEDAMIPALEDALAAAEDEVQEVERLADEQGWSPSRKHAALHEAEEAVKAARLALEQAEAGLSWLGIPAERVAERLAGADVETVRDFVREMVRVQVAPVGRGRRVPVRQRIKVQYLTAGRSAAETLGFEDVREEVTA